MTTDHTTFSDEHDTTHSDTEHRDTEHSDTEHSDTQDYSAGQSQSQTGGGSTAAERLGGPSESETAADRSAAHSDAHASGSSSSNGSDGEARATLIPADRAEGFRKRWTELKGEFVDEPRTAVRGANELVGEVLDELEQLFRRQRDELEGGLDSDDATTEDLRQALGNYRSFFDRLLSF